MDAPDTPVLECNVTFKRGSNGRKRMSVGTRTSTAAPAGRLPRIAKLMALAVKLDGQIRAGELRDWAEVARLARVTRARASQLAALTLLAPDIIEEILRMPPVTRGRDLITERHLRPISKVADSAKQRKMWTTLLKRAS